MTIITDGQKYIKETNRSTGEKRYLALDPLALEHGRRSVVGRQFRPASSAIRRFDRLALLSERRAARVKALEAQTQAAALAEDAQLLDVQPAASLFTAVAPT